MFFTDYHDLVYDTLSFTEPKMLSQLCDEIENQWQAAGVKGIFGKSKAANPGSISTALEVLEQEGLAVKNTVTHKKRTRVAWLKKSNGKRYPNQKGSSFPSTLQPA